MYLRGALAPISHWWEPSLRLKNYGLKVRGTLGCGAAYVQTFQGIEDLFLGSVFRPVNNLCGFCKILHPFLGEGSPDDVPGQVFHAHLTFRSKAITAEDLESGMTPVGEHVDQVFCNSPSDQEHLEDLVPENRLQLFQGQGRSDPEHAPPVEASGRYQHTAVGIETKEFAPGLWQRSLNVFI